MPKFFFDVDDGNGNMMHDEEGIDFPNLKTARDEAIRTLPGMAIDELPDGANHDFKVSVRDQDGTVVFKAALFFRSDYINKKV